MTREDLIDQRATTCRHGGHCEWVACDKCNHYEPKEKTGHWKEVYAETDYHNGWIEFSCENCEYQHGLESGQYGWSYGDPIPWKYCPICGARMVEPQESEEV